MARTLDSFPTENTRGRYPWDDWFDGRVHELSQGEDFTVPPKSFQNAATAAAKAARKRGLNGTLRTALVKGEPKVVIQFTRDDDQTDE